MTVETLVCPHCEEILRSDKTATMDWHQVIRCKHCKETFYLQAARDRAAELSRSSQVPAVAKPRKQEIAEVGHTEQYPAVQYIAPQPTQVVIHHHAPASNPMGVAAFVTALVALLTIGCLSPVALVFSMIAMGKQPRGMAVAGLVLSCIGLLPMAIVLVPLAVAAITAPAVVREAKTKMKHDQEQQRLTPQTRQQTTGTNTKAQGPARGAIRIADVRQSVTGTDNVFVRMQVSNFTNRTLHRMRVAITLIAPNGQVISQDEVSVTLDLPIAPGQTGPASLSPRASSPLREVVPDGSTGSGEAIQAWGTDGDEIQLSN